MGRRRANAAMPTLRSPALQGVRAPSVSMAAHQAAAGDDLAMFGWNPFGGSADADLLPDLDTLTARSRDMGRNNGLMAGAMQTLRDNIVGAVLRLSSTPDYRLLGWSREKARDWATTTEAQFRSWAETTECDASRTQNLFGGTILKELAQKYDLSPRHVRWLLDVKKLIGIDYKKLYEAPTTTS